LRAASCRCRAAGAGLGAVPRRTRVTGALPGARIALHTVRGRVDVAWRRQGSSLVLDLRVPVNAVTEVLLPGGSATSSGQATHRLDW
jgi:alpha-L-rhamnosidase